MSIVLLTSLRCSLEDYGVSKRQLLFVSHSSIAKYISTMACHRHKGVSASTKLVLSFRWHFLLASSSDVPFWQVQLVRFWKSLGVLEMSYLLLILIVSDHRMGIGKHCLFLILTGAEGHRGSYHRLSWMCKPIGPSWLSVCDKGFLSATVEHSSSRGRRFCFTNYSYLNSNGSSIYNHLLPLACTSLSACLLNW